MLSLMSEEDFDACSFTVEQLRLEVYRCNTDLLKISQSLGDQLDPPTPSTYQASKAVREYILWKRDFATALIKDIREVLVEPPSLESRVVGYVAPFLSFSYF